MVNGGGGSDANLAALVGSLDANLKDLSNLLLGQGGVLAGGSAGNDAGSAARSGTGRRR